MPKPLYCQATLWHQLGVQCAGSCPCLHLSPRLPRKSSLAVHQRWWYLPPQTIMTVGPLSAQTASWLVNFFFSHQPSEPPPTLPHTQIPTVRPECLRDDDCRNDQACFDKKCQNPCTLRQPCGVNAECTVRDHTHFCSCIPDYIGNPWVQCVKGADLFLENQFFDHYVCNDHFICAPFSASSNPSTTTSHATPGMSSR